MDLSDEHDVVASRPVSGSARAPAPEAYVAGVQAAIDAAVGLLTEPDSPLPDAMIVGGGAGGPYLRRTSTFLRHVVVQLTHTSAGLERLGGVGTHELQRIARACELLLLVAVSLDAQDPPRAELPRGATQTGTPRVRTVKRSTPTYPPDERQANWVAALILGIANDGAISERDVREVVRFAGWSRPLLELAGNRLSRLDVLSDDTRRRIRELRDRALRLTTLEHARTGRE